MYFKPGWIVNQVNSYSLRYVGLVNELLTSGFTLREYHRWRTVIHLAHPGHDALPGSGVFAQALRDAGYPVIDAEDI
ncbi:MAG: hypothetical protein J6A88_01720 [Oscillospiraceae bacterium]|nr:hypothetical protein [Oscillospiraceae bacterium]